MSNHIEDNVEKAIVKYNKHPSILKIKGKSTNVNIFSLWHTKIDVLTEIILSMEVNKASPKDDIPLKIIKSNYDIFAPLLCNDFNLGIDNKFPDALKTADIKPSFKLLFFLYIFLSQVQNIPERIIQISTTGLRSQDNTHKHLTYNRYQSH